MLQKYLSHCNNLHIIAFMQWRLKYPSRYTEEDELLEIVEERMAHMSKGINKFQVPTFETFENSILPAHFLEKVEMIDSKPREFMIN